MKLFAFAFSLEPLNSEADWISLRGPLELVASEMHFDTTDGIPVDIGYNDSPVFNEALAAGVRPTAGPGRIAFITNSNVIQSPLQNLIVACPKFITQSSGLEKEIYLRLLTLFFSPAPNGIITWDVAVIDNFGAVLRSLCVPMSETIVFSGLENLYILLPCANPVTIQPNTQIAANAAASTVPQAGGVPADISYIGNLTTYDITTWLNEYLDPTNQVITSKRVISFITLLAKELGALDCAVDAQRFVQQMIWRLSPLIANQWATATANVFNVNLNQELHDMFGFVPSILPVNYPIIPNIYSTDYVFPTGNIMRFNKIIMGCVDLVREPTAQEISWQTNQWIYAQMDARRIGMTTQLFYDTLKFSISDLRRLYINSIQNKALSTRFASMWLGTALYAGINVAPAGDFWNNFANEYLGTALYADTNDFNLAHYRRIGVVGQIFQAPAGQNLQMRPMWYPDLWMDRWVCFELVEYSQPARNSLANWLDFGEHDVFQFGSQATGIVGLVLPKDKDQTNFVVMDSWATISDAVTVKNERVMAWAQRENILVPGSGWQSIFSTFVGGACGQTGSENWAANTASCGWAARGFADLPIATRISVNPWPYVDLVTMNFVRRNTSLLSARTVTNSFARIGGLLARRCFLQFESVVPIVMIEGAKVVDPFAGTERSAKKVETGALVDALKD
jgi:hypothetical protein